MKVYFISRNMRSNVKCFEITVLLFVKTITFANQEENMATPSNNVNQIQTNATEPPAVDMDETFYKRSCGWIPGCSPRAKSLSENNKADLNFFKDCIANFYCYKKSSSKDAWIKLPSYQDKLSTKYFNDAAKRIERFFIRNNDWSVILDQLQNGLPCDKLLYVIAARYHYLIYVLNILFPYRDFGPCKYDSETKKLTNPNSGECFVVPLRDITCTSDFDIALMGRRSGSLAARFNQFFLEPLGADKFVPGFGKSSENIFGGNIFAFALEYALPTAITGLKASQPAKGSIDYKLQEVLTAIRKMRGYLPKYYNELLMDQAELKTKPKLHKIFNDIVKLFNAIEEKVAGVTSSSSSDISFRYQHDMARSMIEGIIDSNGKTGWIANCIVEHAMAITLGAEVYHTTGTVLHVFGQMEMKTPLTVITAFDAWVSMLENWADSVKEFNRECEKKGLLVAQCLPKMSKNLYRTLAAMKSIQDTLPQQIGGNDMKVGLAKVTPSIVEGWYSDVYRKGLTELPQNEKSNFKEFLKTFGCFKNLSFDDDIAAFQKCLNAIQNEVRKYNRRMFTYITLKNG